jgi:hypothetical protein
MKKTIIAKNISTTDVSFSDYYEELSNNWELKAERLQTRRWRKLKRDLN